MKNDIFARVDRDFRHIMRIVESDPRLSALTNVSNLSSLLASLINRLVQCQNMLEHYMADKRSLFPRFYFLSDDDLLELLGQVRINSANKDVVIQTHIKKIFPGAIGVLFGPGNASITGMKGQNEEKLMLDIPVDIETPIEVWLHRLEVQMRESLHTNIKQCLLHFEIQKQNITSYPAQVLCLVQSIHFTENAERSISSHNLHQLKGNIQEELNKYLKLKIHECDEPLEESKLQALILQCYHHLQVVNDLIDSGISSPKQWLWQKQLRFYVESKTAICACMGLAKIPYTYEFLGTNIGNLVHTELTDQCFLTLTQALHLGMVGNPFGPAGTGKTESVKALGGLLGRLVLVFNCDEGMDNTTMGRLLSGLALCGAWGCFDEFNRLEEKTLSAVIQQFSSILDAINPKKQPISAVLNGTEVKVLPGCGVFATMNPASAKYGGRRVLPEGLNRLFRPCAMCEPHSVHILSALLAAQGFSNSVENAEKIVLCFEMAKSLLSKSHHYDWGLRALKTIIGSSGSAIKNIIISSKSFPDNTNQTSLIIQALRVNTLSKLSHSDSKRFENILEALFPNENNKILFDEKLALNIKAYCDENNINIGDNQIRRCGELYDQLKQRMGVAIVGPPGCGKTFLRTILKDVLSKNGDNINQHIICPKSLNRKDLLGYIDNDTRQWYDGVISTVSLQVASEKSDIWSWIVCDGDVDPEWIESLNSVLDDNRLLTLPSGWRIQFMKNVNFIFETHDLKYASPATITRMGIILISTKESCYKEVIQKWSNEMKSEEISLLDENVLIDTIGKVLDWAERNSNDFLLLYEKIPLTKQILSFINGYDGIISIDEHLSTSILKAMSCVLKPESIERFLELVSQWTNVSPHAIMWNNSKDRESQLESFSIGNDFFLMNERIYKIINLIDTWIDNDQHFMLFGPPSSGKSLILDYMLKDVRDKIIINLKCTPILDVQHIIQVLKQKSVVKSGNSKSSGRVVLVIKALQRTVSDKWNTSRVQSFLLQLVQYGGFWEKSDETDGKMQWFTLIPFSLIVTCTVEDGNIKLSQRLTNALKVVNLVAPNNKELLEVSELYLSNSLSKLDVPNDDKIKLMQISPRMVSLFEEVSKIFNTEIHYKWTSRDIIKWCQNMCHYKIENFDMAHTIILKEALNIFKNRLKSNREKQAFDVLIQKHFGSFSLHEQMFLPKMTNNGLKLELVDENEYSLSIIKTINQCNSQVDNDAFGEIGAEFCDELKELVSVAIRVLSQTEIVVLVGVAGVGRRAAAKIAAEFFSAKFIIISTPQQFFLNLKNILTTCGSDCTPELVVLEESAASDSNVLGLIEALLSKGESASYLSFYIQEIESMVSQMKSNVGKKTVQKFMENVAMNLGIVLIYDVKQPDLKDLFSLYPILYKQSQLYWLDGWSDITLKDVAIQITKRVLSEEQGLNDCLSIISMGKTMEMFSSLNQDNLKTPYRYIIFLKTYFNIYFERKQFLEEKYKRLKSGVSALIEAKEEVSKMKSNAAQQQKILAEKQTLANTALNQIGTTMQSASVHKQEMETLKNKAEIENLKLQERKKEIEIELSEVEPVIQEARTAVGDIRPESLSEVRSLRAPPEPVRDVLEGVLRLMGIADTSWHSMKTFLSKRSIKDEIKLFDASNISQENLRAVEKLLSTHGASFSEKTAKRASVACAPLAAWVVANVKYANVLQKIAPLEAEQRTLSHNLANAESQIKDLSSDLFTVDERVSALKLELNTYTKQATEIEIGLSSVQTTIEKAEELVSKLSKEFQRWNENLSDLSKEFNEISVKSFIMAGFIAYLTHEIEENKNLIMNEWYKLFDKPPDINIKELFISRNNEIEWVDKGLSSNFASFCNGIVINDTLKEPKRGLVPLIIDPNNEAIQWLSNITEKQPKDIISQNDPKLITILQHALRFGKIFVIKDLTSIDDTWSPLLRNHIPLNIGVNSINPAFRLMLFTRGSKILNDLSVYHKSLLSIVNFTPQKQGLIDQLVFNAVKQEEPELQTKLSEINVKKDTLQVQQDSLEVELLTQLSSGNILQNPDLLESLEHTQKAVNEITSSLKEAADIAAVIKNQCDFYRSVAARVASVCLAISSLTRNFPLININLNTAIKLFLKGLENFRGSINKNESNFENIGKYVVVSLLERVLVASNKKFHPSILIYLMHHTFPENIPQNEWEVIMSNPDTFIYGQADNNSLNEIPEWIDLDRKPYLCAIKTYAPEFYSILHLENENIWRKFISTADWELIPNFDNITPFQKVLIAWALKPTKLSLFLTKATSQILGSNQFYFSGNLISAVENWGSINQPILVIGAAGTDPIDEIKTRATTIVGPNKFKQAWISEISSSETIVESLKNDINWAKDSGGWLVVMVPAGDWPQNEVYQILSELQMSSSLDTIAKIWIVAENSNIPYQLASCCVNVIVEAPTGIKNNLLRILSVWQSQGFVENKLINPKQTRLEFSLALAHSVIQQRCNYIPQGWRHLYNFSWGDLEACLTSVRESDRSIAAGLCKVFYNGRIHWEQDTNLMSSLLDKHFDESVLGHTWKPLGLDVSLPMTTKLQDYITALANFSSTDNPALLNLPNNIQTVHEQIEANNDLTNLRLLTLEEIIHDSNNATIRKKLSPILSLWKKLNANSQSLLRVEYNLEADEHLSGLKVLTICECETAKAAMKNIHKDLVALYSISTSSDKEKHSLALSLISDNTPDTWLEHWNSGPSSANAFIAGLCERAEIAQKRLSKQHDDKSLFVLSLSSFLKPECIIHALIWESSRRLSVAPESLTPIYKWDDDEPDASSGKVVLKDLWLEGGIWENGRLQPCRTDTEIQIKAPPISLRFIVKAPNEFVNKNQAELPVFTSRERKKVIFKVNVSFAEQFSKSMWLLNSTALIIS